MAPDVHHVFPGDSPLGGERHTRDAAASWFGRLSRLFPGHRFQVHRIVLTGWPWSTLVAIEWTAQLRPQVGEPYLNHGTHGVHIKWGKATTFHAYLDTELITAACQEMSGRGVREAAAAPITD